MFSSFALPFKYLKLNAGRAADKRCIHLAPVKTYNVETLFDSRAKRLHSLLKLNHANHSIIYNHLRFHNHMPHILGSSYILGATNEDLTAIYDHEARSLEPWSDSPGEISTSDWRDFLGKKEYQRAYVDFFSDQLVSYGYDWKRLLDYYLFSGDQPLINSGIVCGLGHPAIHLGYGYELESRTVAIEAIAEMACFYDSNASKYIDDASYTRPASYSTPSVLEILRRVAKDDRIDALFSKFSIRNPGADNFDIFLSPMNASDVDPVLLDHWNAWEVTEANATDAFRSIQEAAAVLVAGIDPTNGKNHYDFFLLHVLTTSHALRILLLEVPGKFQVPLLRQWLLFALLAYLGQLRPAINPSHIKDYKLKQGQDNWKYIVHEAVAGRWRHDAHLVKGLRAMKVADEAWGSIGDGDDGYWLKAACKLADEFNGWGGWTAVTTGYRGH